ncbi:uncharacterized protein [Periplaneta americana]|uniref:uncharacterized protein isoform X2 n=2 Tax=Periplaneta americana TaxID=6978 RepID=UPI0037E93441
MSSIPYQMMTTCKMCGSKWSIVLFSILQLLSHGKSSESKGNTAARVGTDVQQSPRYTDAVTRYSTFRPLPGIGVHNLTLLDSGGSPPASVTSYPVIATPSTVEALMEPASTGQENTILHNKSRETSTELNDFSYTYQQRRNESEMPERKNASSSPNNDEETLNEKEVDLSMLDKQNLAESYQGTTYIPEEELSTLAESQTTPQIEGHIQLIPVIKRKGESSRSYNVDNTPISQTVTEKKSSVFLPLSISESLGQQDDQHQLNKNTKYFVEPAHPNSSTSDHALRRNNTARSDDGVHISLLPSSHPDNVPLFEIYPSDGIHNTSIKESHPCARTCVTGAPPMVCRYKFELEWYYTMSKACYNCPSELTDCDRKDCVVADGVKRPIVVVNRQLPGPSVEVCKGDKIIVDMENHMMEESTTIHWHGHHQRGTPYMDGVPYVTQCPIPPKSMFRYHYSADTPGTHFWHSHSGCQRADGAFGALIIRVPSTQDPHRNLYDRDLSEHIMQILDWDHKLGVDKFLAHHHANGNNKPPTLLVNGRGRFFQFEDINFITRNVSYSPTATFTVQKGFRYRFRLINAGFLNCPIEVSVDNHTLLVISSDGTDLKPVEADSLVTYAGERFDFVINAYQKVENYWIRFRGLMDCGEKFTQAHQVAVLHYEGAPEHEEPHGEVSYKASKRTGLAINSLNVGTGTEGSLVIPELDAVAEDDESLKKTPDMTFYLSYDFYKLDNPHYHRYPYYGFNQVANKLLTPQLNHISLKLPPFPLLSQYGDLDARYPFCNESTEVNCENKYCECTHVIEVPLGAVLELILIDKGTAYDANHPFHLHGHAFRVIAMERLNSTTTVEEVQALDRAGLIHRKLSGAPLKDTVTVPDGGYTIVRVHASNPGYWLFHCHIEFHVELGMAVVFKVGDHSNFPPVPSGFPRCNSYIPPNEDVEQINNEMDNIVDISHHSLPQMWPLRSSSESELSKFFVLPYLISLLVCMAVR